MAQFFKNATCVSFSLECGSDCGVNVCIFAQCAEKVYGANEKCVFSMIAHSAESLHNIAVTINAHCAVSLQ